MKHHGRSKFTYPIDTSFVEPDVPIARRLTLEVSSDFYKGIDNKCVGIYIFKSDTEIVDIGQSTQGLRRRIGGYCRSFRVFEIEKKQYHIINESTTCELLIFENSENLHIDQFEYRIKSFEWKLIRHYSPKFNKSGTLKKEVWSNNHWELLELKNRLIAENNTDGKKVRSELNELLQ
ncbi:hypothetical protein AMS62_16795 [Bacillus sp. FJAT-18019]|nr:hypothetical protein AMS62_16795 [Bacillus sp. FJAT-18019]